MPKPWKDLSPEQRERYAAAQRRRRERDRAEQQLKVGHSLGLERPPPPSYRRDVEERLAEIPDEDARDLTGQFFGDPNPADHRRTWR